MDENNLELSSKTVKEALYQKRDEGKIKILSSFFKSEPGQYGEGDIFWGIPVPENRKIAKQYSTLSFENIKALINDSVHEVRLCGFLILVDKFGKSKKQPDKRDEIVNFYLSLAHKANNWDLVDLSCPKILGEWIVYNRKLKEKESSPNESLFGKDILESLSQESNLWLKRISIVSTWIMIRNGYLDDTYSIAIILLSDSHDLIRKAVGWMLREAGKKDKSRLKIFLEENFSNISRTTLRYAIEKFDDNEKRYFMKKGKE